MKRRIQTDRDAELIQYGPKRYPNLWGAEETFDATCTAKKQLIRARQRLVEGRAKWVKSTLINSVGEFCAIGAFFDQNDVVVSPDSANNVHPMHRYNFDANDDALKLIHTTAQSLNCGHVVEFNDAATTTYDDVLALFDLAIAKADQKLEELNAQEDDEEEAETDPEAGEALPNSEGPDPGE